MSSLTEKDRVSLCLFNYTDGRRCRTPRIASHPHFCFYHAQKESQVRSAATLGKDLAYFFSGNYLSACDLNTALSRLIPAVIRGEIKPRLARTVAYMMQTLLQSIHLAQDEYINAFSTDGWRKSIRNSVNSNQDYLFPPRRNQHEPPQPASSTPPQPPQTQPAQAPAPTPPHQPTPPSTQPQPAVPPSQPRTAPHPSAAPDACHPERSEGSRLASAASTSAEEALAIARSLFPAATAPPPPTTPLEPTLTTLPRNH
ncbi:MAG: hypothetical protein WA817_09195 [Candidatus Acidiferrum sp.]